VERKLLYFSETRAFLLNWFYLSESSSTYSFLLRRSGGGESRESRNRSPEAEDITEHHVLGQVKVHTGVEDLKTISNGIISNRAKHSFANQSLLILNPVQIISFDPS
jgi:hypothetical protein